MMRRLAVTTGLVTLITLLAPIRPAAAEDWANWRGPNYDGSTSETNLPTDFSKTKNVKWVAPMPGPSAATPIICGDRVFVSAAVPADEKLLAICLDRKTGKLLWQHQVGSGYQNSDKTNYASPSPVTDGKTVAFLYGQGDLAAFSVDGKRLWSINLQEAYGEFTYQWTYSASPAILFDKLYVQVLQRNTPVHDRGVDGQVSYILALDPATGKELYRHVRPTDAVKESREAYTTPIPYTANGKKQFIITGGDVLTGHDPDTGKELWRWGTYNPGHREVWWRLVPTAVIGDGVALVCAPKKAPIYAIDLKDASLKWQSPDRSVLTSDVPTPLFYQGKFFVLSDLRRALSRIEPQTGKIEWTTELPGFYKWRSSPTGADGKIYFMNHHADVIIVDPADGKIVNQIAMGEESDDNTRSSIAAAHGNLFIRTNGALYCIGD